MHGIDWEQNVTCGYSSIHIESDCAPKIPWSLFPSLINTRAVQCFKGKRQDQNSLNWGRKGGRGKMEHFPSHALSGDDHCCMITGKNIFD